MNIVGIKGAFSTEAMFIFPKHKDFKLIEYKESHNADVYIQTNVLGVMKKKNAEIYQFILDQNKPRIVVEQATFRKNLDIEKSDDYYFRVGLNHYTFDEGIFKNENSPSDRWEQIQKEQDIEIKPWKKKGDYILILTQNPIDTSLNNIVKKPGDYENFIRSTIENISKYTDEDILIRPHPRFTFRFNKDTLKDINVKNKVMFSENLNNFNVTNGGEDIYKDLENARVAISYSSNSLTEAICEGVPCISLSKTSHAYPVSFHTLDVLRHKELPEFDRTQWLYDCSYTQWKMSELNSGIVHERLLSDYNA
mgnify:FL=1|tara:strand:+ start:111 stop:1034 length:924 start_codon:yes stop_codon:yes gene_type:complete